MVRSEFQLLDLMMHFSSVMILWLMASSAILLVSTTSVLPSITKPGCQTHCGDVAIPYPFGIGEARCYLTAGPESVATYINVPNNTFQVLCNNSKPFLNLTGTIVELLEISIDEETFRINGPITFSNCPNKPSNRQLPILRDNVNDSWNSPFFYSSKKNRFTSISCGGLALMIDPYNSSEIIGGCLSICNEYSTSFVQNNSCVGINCCQTSLPEPGLQNIEARFGQTFVPSENKCKYAFLVDQHWFTLISTNISLIRNLEFVPVVLKLNMDWYTNTEIYGTKNWTDRHNSTYEGDYGSRFCSKGFQGNPYLLHGCKDIDECEQNPPICGSNYTCVNEPGSFRCQIPDPVLQPPYRPVKLGVIVASTILGVIIFVLIGGIWSRKVMKKRKSTKRKLEYFKSLLLDKHSSSGQVKVEKIKLFNSKELDKATDYYNVDRILGQGGQGTVYKGMLPDGRIVAVKKSKLANGGDLEVRQFINEIVIISQIIHRNVVKLLGCCLETEFPLLVYEFVSNGTLSEYIFQQNEDFPLTWEMRLRVGIEVSGALSYLHSAAVQPIYHRDIKSSNILLDEKYRAKVADFGTSRSVSIDQTHVTTLVQGTFGYIDPEYFRSGQFTEKSDVYSFGVVLAELLTGQKPVSLTRSQEGRSLVNYFLLYMEQNLLFDILDPRISKDCCKEEILAVANIAKRCLHTNGRSRPTMKEVACELEVIQFSSKASDQLHQNFTNVPYVPTHEITPAWAVVSTSTSPCSSSFYAQPQFTSNTT